MTEQQILMTLYITYFALITLLGTYLIWREWQWAKKEVEPYENRPLPPKTKTR